IRSDSQRSLPALSPAALRPRCLRSSITRAETPSTFSASLRRRFTRPFSAAVLTRPDTAWPAANTAAKTRIRKTIWPASMSVQGARRVEVGDVVGNAAAAHLVQAARAQAGRAELAVDRPV